MISAAQLLPRSVRRALLPVGLLLLSAILPAVAQAAPSVPAWRIESVGSPTHLHPGDESGFPTYAVTARNVGGAATDGSPITITDELAAGLTLDPTPESLLPGPEVVNDGGSKIYEGCDISAVPFFCTVENLEIQAGEILVMFVPFDVAANMPPSVVNHVSVSGGGALGASGTETTPVTTEPVGFGFQNLQTYMTDNAGAPFTQAGGHPYVFHTDFQTTSVSDRQKENPVAGTIKDVVATLPKGFVVNPSATPVKCTEAQFEASVETDCPDSSAVGIIHTHIGGLGFSNPTFSEPLWNLVPPPGQAASFGFNPGGFGIYAHLLGNVNSAGEYQLTATTENILEYGQIAGITVELWGNPTDPSHDARRGKCAFPSGQGKFCSSQRIDSPLLTMPSSCGSEPGVVALTMDSWQESGKFVSGSSSTVDASGNPIGVDGCNKLEFKPTISSQPTTNVSDSPTGLDFNLHQPQSPSPEVGTDQRVQCSPGAWSQTAPRPTGFSYQWLRNGTPIEGETERQYSISEEDQGKALQCEVAAENGAAGPGHAVSPPTVVRPLPSVKVPTPVKPFVGFGITPDEQYEFQCETGAWEGSPTFQFSWYENGDVVAGAEAAKFKIPEFVEGEDEEGNPAQVPNKATVQCRAAGTNAGGTVVAFSNNASTNPPPAPELTESISVPAIFIPEEVTPIATANLKDAKVALPQGLVLNPSAANGLGSCDENQIGFRSGQSGIHFSEDPQTCPDSAKVGSLEVLTPLLEHRLPGSIYVAKPFDNPFGSFLAIYLAIEDKQSGVISKLAGKVDLDPTSGQLTATFTENPELPIEDITLHFFSGPRAALTSPFACGAYTTDSELVPWSTPEGQPVNPVDSFTLTSSPAAGCVGSEAQAPNVPTFSAGTLAPQAGAFSPFLLKLVRADGTQHITGIDTTLPGGLVGKLAGIPYCSEGAIALARSREAPEQGKVEQASPSCPAASEVGTVTVGAGAGISPFYVTGHAYLAGPYKGAPLSLVTIVPAVAGPFDLGDVVTRIALNVGEYTAQIHAVSDPLPTIIQGIPLDVRSIALTLDRPGFTLNPTSCEASSITGSVTAASGQVAPVQNSFQVGECKSLAFKPSLKLSLKGPTKRTGHPALKAVVTFPSKGTSANIAKAQVGLPHGEFLDNANIGTVCTQPQLKAQSCPPASIYGKAKAWTPLLDHPLEGPVYLGAGFGHKLPDLVADLNGQIRVLLHGKIDTDKRGGIRNTFEAVPDAPVSKFVLEMKGGKKKGLLVNSENVCRKEQKAEVKFTAQNGKVLTLNPKIANSCKGKRKGKKKGAQSAGKH